MNVTPQFNNLPLATVFNPQTDSLRRENVQREVISQPAPTNQSAKEKGTGSDRSKTTEQSSDRYNFVALQNQAEQSAKTIQEQPNQQQSQQQPNQQSEEANQQSADGSDETETKSAQQQQQEKAVELEVQQLKSRDKEVRAHEAAHAAVGGSVTGAPSFSYEQGPDGVRYATDGEVSVDVSPVKGDPQATIAKMQLVHAAALAPNNPSSQDKKVAAKATKQIAQAQAELLKIKEEKPDNAPNIRKKFKQDDTEVTRQHAVDTPSSLNSQNKSTDNSFDQLINRTLLQQEEISPSTLKISVDVQQRAQRISAFYATITQADTKPSNHQFQLTA